MKLTHLLLLMICFGNMAVAQHHDHDHEHQNVPFALTENLGQWHPNVAYKAERYNGTYFLEKHAFTYVFQHEDDLANRDAWIHTKPQDRPNNLLLRSHAYRVHFENASATTTLSGQLQQAGYSNFFLGDDESKWKSGVKSYSGVRYNELYQGIDLLVRDEEGHFKYDFISEAGADVSQIALRFEGVDQLQITNGKLEITTSIGTITEEAPLVWTVTPKGRVQVACNYVLEGNTVRFQFPNGYNTAFPLVIDPVVVAATLSGTTGTSNYGHCATYDNQGNIYTGAISFGTGYPVTTGAYQTTMAGGGTDIAISKLNPDGTNRIWATYLGGSDSDYPHSMFVNDNNELAVLGSTSSTNFPTTTGAVQTAFGGTAGSWTADIIVTKFNATATGLVGSTYLGGTDDDGRNGMGQNYGDYYRGEIIQDAFGNILVASCTNSSNFPTTTGAFQTTHAGSQEGVVFKLDQTLSNLLWSTFLGTTADDMAYGLREDTNGDIVVAGATGGTNFPTTTGTVNTTYLGAIDGYVLRLNPIASSITASTFVGSAGRDECFFVDIDSDGDVYVYGQNANAIPITPAGTYGQANSRQFIQSFSQDLTTENFATSIGTGSATGGGGGWVQYDFVPIAFMVDQCGFIYASGHGAFGSLPLTSNAFYTTGGFYLFVLQPDALGLEFGTMYGADHVDGGTSRFDPNGIVYQAVCTAGGFQTNANAWSTNYPNGYDVGVFKINFQVLPIHATASAAPSQAGCAPFTVTFNNSSIGVDYIWDFGDGSPTSTAFQPTHTYTTAGVFDVMLVAIDSSACIQADTFYLQMNISTPTPVTADFTTTIDCATQSVICTNNSTGGLLTYQWDMGDMTTYTSTDVNHTYTNTGTYDITLIAADTFCNINDTIQVPVTIAPTIAAAIDVAPDSSGCAPFDVNFINNSTPTPGTAYAWDFGDGSPISTDFMPAHTYTTAGNFNVMLTASDPNSCNLADTAYISMSISTPIPVVADFVPSIDCATQSVDCQNTSTGGLLVYDWDMDDGAMYTSTDVNHAYGALGSYDITLIASDTICNNSDTVTVNIVLLPNVTADFDITPDSVGCAPFNVDFINTSNGIDYSWNFDDGSPLSTQTDPSHTYNAGSFNATLIAHDPNTCNQYDTATMNITVHLGSITADFDVIQTGPCEAFMVEAINQSVGNMPVYEWNMGDGTVYTTTDVNHGYASNGPFTITLVATDTFCYLTDTMTITIGLEDGASVDLGPDVALCPFQSATMDAGPGDSYLWSNGLTSQTINSDTAGTFTVVVQIGTCDATDSVTLTAIPEPELGYSTEICLGEQAALRINWEGAYQWETGDDTDVITVEDPGYYTFAVTDTNNCTFVDSIEVIQHSSSAMVYVPNAFTPNGDTQNDVFKAEGLGFETFELLIFDRWGNEIWKSSSTDVGWDGTLLGTIDAPVGVYVYKLTYDNPCMEGKQVIRHGHVTLVR